MSGLVLIVFDRQAGLLLPLPASGSGVTTRRPILVRAVCRALCPTPLVDDCCLRDLACGSSPPVSVAAIFSPVAPRSGHSAACPVCPPILPPSLSSPSGLLFLVGLPSPGVTLVAVPPTLLTSFSPPCSLSLLTLPLPPSSSTANSCNAWSATVASRYFW